MGLGLSDKMHVLTPFMIKIEVIDVETGEIQEKIMEIKPVFEKQGEDEDDTRKCNNK